MELNIFRLEAFARIPRNTIHHSISKEKRPMKLAYEDAIYKQLSEMEEDLSNAVVEYWQRTEQNKKELKLPSSHGSNSNRQRNSKR